MKKRNLTKGNVTAVMLLFAVPMILGNIMQQCYNLADTWIVGRFVGAEALAARFIEKPVTSVNNNKSVY